MPSDYEYVAIWTMNIHGIGEAEFMLREREIARRHMERTGGTYAHVETSGSCQVCGNVQAIYLVLFYHAKSNTYIRVGFDCTRKLEMSGDLTAFNLFRRNVQNAREAQAGKRKAIAILADAGMSEAWDIYTAEYPQPTQCMLCDGVCKHQAHNSIPWEERTITDIVGKLVKYGNISEKQSSFVASLLNKIVQRPIIEAQRQAEKDAAGPVPTGRVEMVGEVVGTKVVEDRFAYRSRYSSIGHDATKTMLIIKLENGSKVYGSRFDNLERGSKVRFVATVHASDNDPKFGFYKRPKVVVA